MVEALADALNHVFAYAFEDGLEDAFRGAFAGALPRASEGAMTARKPEWNRSDKAEVERTKDKAEGKVEMTKWESGRHGRLRYCQLRTGHW
jgi:hypothetical protein